MQHKSCTSIVTTTSTTTGCWSWHFESQDLSTSRLPIVFCCLSSIPLASINMIVSSCLFFLFITFRPQASTSQPQQQAYAHPYSLACVRRGPTPALSVTFILVLLYMCDLHHSFLSFSFFLWSGLELEWRFCPLSSSPSPSS